ncbi:MAG: roadblock/LC7 domain-containing protein [Planctomycetota bacterium]
MNRDDTLKQNRLVYYEEDVALLDAELDEYLELSKARSVLLVDRDGHLVTRRGEPMETSEESVAALIAGSFAATREMARLLGEPEFRVMSHQGSRDSIQLHLVGDRTLMATLFDARTNLGMVRFYAQESCERIRVILSKVEAEERTAGLASGFGNAATQLLDDLL